MNWVPFSILDALEFPWRSPEPPTLAGTVSKRHGHSLGREGETGPRQEVARSPPPAPPWALTHSLPSRQTQDGHLVVHSHARVSSLTLKSIQYTDAGEYVCTASNTIGQDSQSMYLEVQCEPQLWKDEGRGLCRVGLREGTTAARTRAASPWLCSHSGGSCLSHSRALSPSHPLTLSQAHEPFCPPTQLIGPLNQPDLHYIPALALFGVHPPSRGWETGRAGLLCSRGLPDRHCGSLQMPPSCRAPWPCTHGRGTR